MSLTDDERDLPGPAYLRHVVPQLLAFGAAWAGLGVGAGLVFVLVAGETHLFNLSRPTAELIEPAAGLGALGGALLGALLGTFGGIHRARAEWRWRAASGAFGLAPEAERALRERFAPGTKEAPAGDPRLSRPCDESGSGPVP